MSTPPVEKRRQPKRSRIVIDVERARQAAHVPRRPTNWQKALSPRVVALAAGLLLVVAGSYALWQSYKKSPEYSLALLIEAAQRNDLRAVEELVDSDRVTGAFVPQVIEKLAAGEGRAVPAPVRRQIEAALPQFLPRVRETMREEMARFAKEVAARSGEMPFLLRVFALSRASETKEEGDIATVTFNTEDRPTELKMQRSGERWKIISVKDDAMAAGIAERVQGSLPFLGGRR
jgi:hypothetical protein